MTRLVCPLRWALFAAACIAAYTDLAHAGKLDRAGSAARRGSSSSSSSSSRSSSSSGGSWSSSEATPEDYANSVILTAYAAYYAFLGITSPYWAPYHVLEGDLPRGSAKSVRFADYPYAEGAKGFLLRPPTLIYGWDGVARSLSGDRVVPRQVQGWAAQLGAESGIGVVDGIARFGVRARLQLPMRWQFDAEWSLLREHDREGVDVVLMGREHLSVRFAESSQVQFYSGIGPQHFCDSRGCIHGIDLTWGFEAFPGRPTVFGLEGSIGNLERAFAPGLRTRFGVLFGPVEASLGWHQRWVAGIPLGGPFFGLTGWF